MTRLTNDEDFKDYFNSPEFKKILHDYEAMLESGKNVYFDADQLTDIAEFYASYGAHEEAETAIEHALQLHPGSTDPMVFKTRNLLARGEVKAAWDLCTSIPTQNDFEVVLLYAEIHLATEEPEKAEQVLKRFFEHSDNEPDQVCVAMRDCSEVFTDYKYFEYSLKWGRKLLEYTQKHANNKENIFYAEEVILMALRDLDRYEEALELSNRMLDKDPYYIPGWIVQSEIYVAQKKYNEAVEAADYALAIDKDNLAATFSKANGFLFLENLDEALKLYKQCIKRGYHTDVCHYMCGLAEGAKQNHQQAINELMAAYKLVGDMADYSYELLYNLALNFAALGYIQDALFFCHQSEVIDPDNETLRDLIVYLGGLDEGERLPDDYPYA